MSVRLELEPVLRGIAEAVRDRDGPALRRLLGRLAAQATIDDLYACSSPWPP
ncbi:hypothetical protein GCM10018781_77860 [Kitasatospora indigofera]|uniref:Uncharacterized protein n=1 Tax=Kitasatospora indigofera TaxID=67307 RepID=A0A918YWB0_9ACTN|nr:hypothetical protein [Kitasatospora indigofera]GHE25871.1 hypothetical protein GCM10018781_77860 [Kitasatospora indigofera]